MGAAFVLDASVLVEFLTPGSYEDAADRLMSGIGWREPLALFAPDLILLEATNAFRKLEMRNAISQRAASRAVSQLAQLAIATVASSALFEKAWLLRKRLTVYDAVYVVLARGLELPLVTADRRLARTARGAGVRAYPLDARELSSLLEVLRASNEA
jgi:predicted nucleic acid-binding protein